MARHRRNEKSEGAMKKSTSIAALAAILLVIAEMAFATDPFHIASRQLDLSQTGESLSGYLAVDVMNASGEAAQDVVIWVPAPNKVTYDNRSIFVGDLSDGQPRGIFEPFTVPVELLDQELPDEPVTWRVEYTNPAGERIEIDVTQLDNPEEQTP